MDFGKDYYATVTYKNIPNEERVLALPQSIDYIYIYSGLIPKFQFRSNNDRELTLFKTNGEYLLNVVPAREVIGLRDVEVNIYYQSQNEEKKLYF